MPEASADPFVNVGYLIAAAAVTLVTLIGYAGLLAQRLSRVRQRNRQLKGE